jgi:type VI secretion system protein VasJ
MAGVADPRVAAVAAPLPPGAPDPAEFRYDAAFEALEAEVRRGDKGGPAAVRWAEVARQAMGILETQSKDLMAASWFVVAVARTDGLPGLAVGLAALRALIEAHWETMFPPTSRERARVQALDWLATHAARTLPEMAAGGQLSGDPGPAALAAMDDAAAIVDLLGAKLTKEQVPLGELVRALRPLSEAARRAEADRSAAAAAAAAPPPGAAAAPPAVAAAPPAAAPPAAGAPSRPAAAIAPPAMPAVADVGIEKAFSAMQAGVRDVALAAMQADLRDARAYALLRAVTWIGITEAPPSIAGRTQLQPPPATRLSEFIALQSSAAQSELVLGLERFLSASGLFWLDGQRMVHQALTALGAEFSAAARAVVRGVALTLERLPFLPGLAFQDGTPCADGATQAWIARSAGAAAAGQGTDAAAATDAPWVEGLDAAQALSQEGKLEAALGLLATGGAAASSGRQAFRWRLALARLCLESGQAPMALPILRRAVEEAQAIEQWEPDALADALVMLHRCLATSGPALALDEQARSGEMQHALSMLALVDPVNALRALIRTR